jgi:hypothetical protein
VGRTTHYINVFGEELIVDNADKALHEACKATGAIVVDYTAAPIFIAGEHQKARHEWIIEFSRPPQDIVHFTKIVDNELKKVNSDYEAKRSNDLLLQLPLIHLAPAGTFLSWLASRNKLGGQHKVPRLQNNRDMLEEILKILECSSRI